MSDFIFFFNLTPIRPLVEVLMVTKAAAGAESGVIPAVAV